MKDMFAGERPLDHVAIAVRSLDLSCPLFELVSGSPCSPPETLESQGVRVTFTGAVELLEPLAPDTAVGRFLARRGPGLHHIAFRTEDIRADLDRLRSEGLRLIDQEPRFGSRGHLVAFVHPESAGGVLVELVERQS